jgi:hypothetical protein
MLMGLVTRTVLLVDFTNQGLREGKNRHDAISTLARCLRPILMTTMAMIFGMLPTSGLRRQRAERADGARGDQGIITSTMLTLVVVPVLSRTSTPGGARSPRGSRGACASPPCPPPNRCRRRMTERFRADSSSQLAL